MFNSLDESRLKGVHLRLTVLSAGGYFLDGYDLSIISVAILVLSKQFSFSTSSIYDTLLIGSTLLGMIFGGVLGGYLSDRSGRKSLYMWDMVLFIVFTVLTAISTTYTELLIFRLLLGVAIGADYAISPTIIAEFAPMKHRGKLLTLGGLFWFIGAALSYAVGFVFLPLGDISWRYMFLLGLIPAVLVLVLRTTFKESPRWLTIKGRTEEAKESISMVVKESVPVIAPKPEKYSFRILFNKKYLKATVFVSVFWFILDAITYVIALDGPSILVKLGLTASKASGTASIIAIVALAGGVLTFFLIDVAGRKTITTIGFLGMGITLLLSGFILLRAPSILAIVLLFIVFEISQEFGPGITNSIYPQELFPTLVRATAQGFGTTISRIGAVLGIFTFGFIVAPYGYGGGMFFLALLSFIGVAVTLLLGTETKGKSLESLAGGG